MRATHTNLVAVADDLLDVLALAKERSVLDPLPFLVPAHPDRPAFRAARRHAVV